MNFFKTTKTAELTVAQKNEMMKCQAKINCQKAYGYLSAQSVAIEYNRLQNMDFSAIRFDEKCSNMGTAGR